MALQAQETGIQTEELLYVHLCKWANTSSGSTEQNHLL